MNKILERNHYYLGKDSKSVVASKGHYHILETPPLRCKSGILLIFLRNSDTMVAKKPISKRIDFLAPNTLQYLICKWIEKWVMQACII